MDRRRVRACIAAARRIRRFDHESILFLPTENVCVWHVLVMPPISDTSDEEPVPYNGGEFLFELRASTAYPATPPVFTALTPNGVYKPASSLCVSVGAYHPDEWQKHKSMGMTGFAAGAILNGLLCHKSLGDGIGILHTSDSDKARLAAESREYNATHFPDVFSAFDALMAEELAKGEGSLLAARTLRDRRPNALSRLAAGWKAAPDKTSRSGWAIALLSTCVSR
jgi:hypothetical protein